MKDRFSEFYNEIDFNELWKNCTFVFDTNILLNLYGFTKEEYDEFIDILEDISNRLWMPNQIGWEYQKNRYIGIEKSVDKYNALNSLVNLNPQLKQIKNSIAEITELQIDYVNIDLVNECLKEIDSSIKKMSAGINKPDLNNDKIRDRLTSLYNGKVGAEYTISRLEEIRKEAKYRNENNIPPGFRDKNKKVGNPFGDFILWNQIIDYAREKNKPIIFITEDSKDDWWLNNKPHPFLIKEFSSTGQEFYMYKYGDFLSKANNYLRDYLKTQIKQETIQKVRKTEKIRDLTDKLKETDESVSQENEMALMLEVMAKEPELFRKLIKPGYILTQEDNALLLNLMFREPELFTKIMKYTGQNFTEQDKLLFEGISKHPELIDIVTDELELDTSSDNEENSSVNVKEEKKQENKKPSQTKPKKSKSKRNKRKKKR